MDGFVTTAEVIRVLDKSRYEIRCTATNRLAISFTPTGFQVDERLRFLRSSYLDADGVFRTRLECLLTGQRYYVRSFRCREDIVLSATEVLRVENDRVRRYARPGPLVSYIFDRNTVGAPNGAFFQQYVFDGNKLRKTARFSVDNYRVILTSTTQLDSLRHVDVIRPVLQQAANTFDYQHFENLYPFSVCFCAFAKNAGYSDYGLLTAVRSSQDLRQVLQYAVDNCLMILWNVSYLPKDTTQVASFRHGYRRKPWRWLVDIDSPSSEVLRVLPKICDEYKIVFIAGIQSASGNIQLITDSEAVVGNNHVAKSARHQFFQRCHLSGLKCDYTSLQLTHFFFLPGFPVISKNLRSAKLIPLPTDFSDRNTE